MFSFFRRSKKTATPSEATKDLPDKKPDDNGFVKENTGSPTGSQKDTSKNNLPTTQTHESAPKGGQVTCSGVVNESRLTENADIVRAPLKDDVLSISHNETTKTNSNLTPNENSSSKEISTPHENSSSKDMEVKEPSVNIVKPLAPISYANMLKKDQIKPTRMVKPCGHGTLAVAPKIPISSLRRDSFGTPSDEIPKLELKSYFRNNSAPLLDRKIVEPIQENKKTIQENPQEKPSEGYITPTKPNLPSALVIPDIVKTTTKPPLSPPKTTILEEIEMKNLINQEAKFQSQLNDLSKQLSQRDAEVSKLRFQLEELQRDVFAKSAGMDRLQAELQAAQKESEALRTKLKSLDDELSDFRHKNCELSDELTRKTETYNQCEKEAKVKIRALEYTIDDLKSKISTLDTQIDELKKEQSTLETAHTQAIEDREQEKKNVEVALEKATQEKAQVDQKWEQEFEKLRTINILKEQQLLDDFEWKLREVEKRCKKRLEEKDKDLEIRLHEACKDAEIKMKTAQEMMTEVEHLKTCASQVNELKTLTEKQEESLKSILEQKLQMQVSEQRLREEAKRLRTLVDIEQENLQHLQRVHNREIMEKERTLQSKLEEKKTEVAMYWEERLLHECGRLKSELEQLHNEEKTFVMNSIRKEKEDQLLEERTNWEKKLQDSMKEIAKLKTTIKEKEKSFQDEMVRTQTNTDREFMELRRLINKIDMMHHDKFEKLVAEHDQEMERINDETEKRVKEIETAYQNQVTSLRATLELVKEQMEKESQQKIEMLIEQHRSELDTQWDNLVLQKSEAVKLVEDEYVTKYKTLEEQFYTQQKSHQAREIELLKSIDSLKNEVISKDCTLDDLQNNVDTLEGGIQVLHQEIAQQGEQLLKVRRDSDYKISTLQETITALQEQQQKERNEYEVKVQQMQKQAQGTIDHLTRKCDCLTKLFEEVRARYERRESRQEDLNVIADLRQVIAEQEKDLACINEEKRYFQMRLMNLERQLEQEEEYYVDTEDFDNSAQERKLKECGEDKDDDAFEIIVPPSLPNGFSSMIPSQPLGAVSIPPTIPECDEC